MPVVVAQGHDQRIVVGGVAAGARKEVEDLEVGERLLPCAQTGKIKVQKQIRKVVVLERGGVPRGHASGGGTAGAGVWYQVFKPRLGCDGPRRDSCAQFGRDGVESLGEVLPRSLILEHVGNGVEVHAVRKVPAEAPDVADLKDHLAGEAPLQREIDHVAASDLEIGVVLETQDFAQRNFGNDRRGQRRGRGRHGDRSVDAHSKQRAAGCRIDSAVGAGGARGGAGRRVHVDGLRKAHAEHRDDHTLDSIDAVIGDAVSPTNDCLAVAEQLPEKSGGQARIPGRGYARGDVAEVDIEHIRGDRCC